MKNLTPEQVLKLFIIGTVAMVVLCLLVIGIVIFFSKQQRKWNKELQDLKKQKEGKWYYEVSISHPEERPDCAEFELKEYPHQCGDCQTDGHYLCINCKHIASFEDMELSDNRERYYPKQYKQELQQVVGTMEGDKCNRNGCEGILEYTHPANCSCHINPPCSACTSTNFSCPVCGWEDK